MKRQYHIIPINLTAMSTDEPISDVPCGSCTKCCELLTPFLTPEEVASGLYPISLINPDPGLLLENSNIGPTVAMFKNKSGGCGMFVAGACTIYEYRPIACRQFDCRKGHHPKLLEVAKSKFGDINNTHGNCI
jgi:Fe-S-cluster containining protein